MTCFLIQVEINLWEGGGGVSNDLAMTDGFLFSESFSVLKYGAI